MKSVPWIGPLAAVSLCFFGCAVEVNDADPAVESVESELKRLPVTVDFDDCVEGIGVELVPTANVRARVPATFALPGDGAPVTPLVVRTANCRSVDISLSFPEAEASFAAEQQRGLSRRISVEQIGPIVISPDGTGDVNVYTLYYHTDDLRLFTALRYAGISAELGLFDYRYRPAVSRLDVKLLAVNHRFELGGSVGALTAPPVSFVSNWWASTTQGIVKIGTTVPVLVIANADLTLTTPSGSALANLLGAPSVGFSLLEQFNGFSSAQSRF